MKENLVENQVYLTPVYKLMNDLLSKICINNNLIAKNISSEILDPLQEICLNCSKTNKEILTETKNVNISNLFFIVLFFYSLYFIFFLKSNLFFQKAYQ